MGTVRNIICILATILLISSCKELVPVVQTVDRWHERTDTLHDSINVYVKVKEWMKGDTVYRDSIQKEYILRYINHTDSFVKVDSIPKIVKVEKELTRYQRLAIDYFGDVVILLVICGMFLISTFLNRKK